MFIFLTNLGIGSNVMVEISAEIRKIKLRNRFILSCSSCWTPDVDGVNIDVNGVWEDGIRYHEGLCYHKQNKCRPETCLCTAKGKNFTWTYISDLPYIKFTCAMRFKDATKYMPIKRQAVLVYNDSGIIFVKGGSVKVYPINVFMLKKKNKTHFVL